MNRRSLLPAGRGLRVPAPDVHSHTVRIEALEPRLLLTGAPGVWGVFADAALTQPGLMGSYVNQALSGVTDSADWRTTQPISGTRLDAALTFETGDWGSRAEVGVTGGHDGDWDDFSVQWDGYLRVEQAGGVALAAVADDAARFWVDSDLSGTFDPDELVDNNWGSGQGPTMGPRSQAFDAGVYPIRIQYYEFGGGNVFDLAGPTFLPDAFVPTPTNPVQTVKVLVLNFEPRIPSEGNQRLWEVFNWNDPRDLAAGFEADLEWASGGALDIQVVQWRDLDEFPLFTDGYRYSPAEYVENRRTNTGWHDATTDFYALAAQQDLTSLVNSGAIDEIWCFGDHYFNLFGEDFMAGPGAFFVNGPVFPDIGFDRAIAGYGFNYERGVESMIHDLMHRIENHGQRAYGGWNLANPQTPFDRYSANWLETAWGPYGLGTCHVPANADGHYDYWDTRVVDSTAWDWRNYPNLTGATAPVGRDSWAWSDYTNFERDYFNWYLGLLPRAEGLDAQGRQANWYKYIWDFNSYEEHTGLARNEDAVAGAGPVEVEGSSDYAFTVTYYDEQAINPADIGPGDVRVIGPGGYNVLAVPDGPGVERATTAGTARVVTYRVTPPGGSWDLGDGGTYWIDMQAGQVRDTLGHYVPGGTIGRFQVALPDPARLDINAMLAGGEATVSHTTFDDGPVGDLFDGNPSTLVRTPNIDPAVVQLQFTEPQTLSGFRALFSHAWGDPAYTWRVETADNLTDLASHSGSYRLAVPITGTPSDVYSEAMLATPVTARVVRLTATRETGDNYVHINEWQLLSADAAPEADPPTASLDPLAEVSTPGGASQLLDVAYSDATAIATATVRTGNVRVTGPGGFDVLATFYTVSDHTNGPERTGTYWFIPPGGTWDCTDNGTYTVSLLGDSVRDVFGNAAAPATLGSFTVAIPAPQTRPDADMTENNADLWTGWADGGWAEAFNDTARVRLGDSSIRFETDGGFDTSLRYPPAEFADWDLSAAEDLHFEVYADNPNPGFQENSPWIRLFDAEGDYYEYRYYRNGNPYDLLNDARGQWLEVTVPLEASGSTYTGWRRSAAGEVDLAHIVAVEIHADTWGNGFTLWFDGMGFTLPDEPVAVVASHVFYNNSVGDGHDPGLGEADDGAIDPNVALLQPGQMPGPANVIAGQPGITGIMLDIAGLGAGPVSPTDFTVRVSDGDSWLAGPVPSAMAVRPGAGAGGSDRVTLAWPDGAITGRWIELTALTHLGLAAPYTVRLGNLAGDFNGDRRCDDRDLNILLGHWGDRVWPGGGDATIDGQVDDRDLNVLLSHWGDTLADPPAEVLTAGQEALAAEPAPAPSDEPTLTATPLEAEPTPAAPALRVGARAAAPAEPRRARLCQHEPPRRDRQPQPPRPRTRRRDLDGALVDILAAAHPLG